MVVFDVTRMRRNAVAADADVRIGFSSLTLDFRELEPLKIYIGSDGGHEGGVQT